MIEKFDKIVETKGFFVIATILDPRNKMDCIDYYLKKINNEGVELELERIRGLLDHLLMEYQIIDIGSIEQEGACSRQPPKVTMKRKSPDTFDIDNGE